VTAGPDVERTGELVGGKYKIVRLLARGGMGVVYEAHHAVVRRRFAIKFLRRDLAERRDILTRFQREAEAAGALENENVTAAVDFGISDDGTPYIVMEYLVGEDLASLLERDGQLPVGRAADLVAQACRGVEAAHATGIVHRDLKPQNLFVCRRDDGTDLVKVLDFGVAKLQALDEASAATRTGTVLGTVAYMSPEQARGEKTIDKKADVYGLGAILYELLSQRKPHPGDSHNAILHHIATQPAVPLASVRAGLPAALVEVVGRALASDPAARPASAGALAHELAPLARREPWPAPPGDTGPGRAALTSTVLAAQENGAEPARPSATGARPPRRRRARVLAGAGVVVAGAALAIAGGVRSRPQEAPPAAPARRAARVLDPATQFYVPPPRAAAAQQIAAFAGARALHEAALMTALEAVPRAAAFTGGTPEQVETDVRTTLARAANDGTVPVLATSYIPYRGCGQNMAGGARDATAYRAWVEGLARGIGNDKAVVVLEPTSLGIIPNNRALDGSPERCRPTVTNAEGKPVAAPGATPDEHYALLAYAVDVLANRAPNAYVYLDGTHSHWLSVADIAYRLAKVGVDRVQGFAVNVDAEQPTSDAIRYGTWISKCLAHARRRGNAPAAFRDCPGPPGLANPAGATDWDTTDVWYRDHADGEPTPDAERAHFVVDNSRNGRGPLDVSIYAGPPYNQPPEVLAKLGEGGWCNPPNAGAGARPTARTGVPLVDAFLWIRSPGDSDGSCNSATGPRARAWDYARFNPWGIAGDTQKHFDPLWGMVDPEDNEWFPEFALQLARNANPPLETSRVADAARGETIAVTATGSPPGGAAVAVNAAGRPRGHPERGGRPGGHSGRPAPGGGAAATPAATPAPPPARADGARALPPTFDPDNPYR
jgi:endoglucanase